MKSVNLLILFFIYLLSIFSTYVNAQVDVHLSIAKVAKKKISIAVPDFSIKESIGTANVAAVEGANILKNDLNLSGLFDIIDVQNVDQINRLDLNEDAVHYSMWSKLDTHAVIKGEYAVSDNGIIVELSLFDVTNKRYVTGKRYRGKKFHLRQMMHKFADETVFHLTNEKGVAQTKIAFVSFQSGHKELFIIDFDGYEKSIKQISRQRSLVLFPDWSPEGRRLVYTSYKHSNPNLKVFSFDKGKNKMIVAFPGLNANPSWSPDGEKIAFTASKDGNPEIYTIDTKGNTKRLTHFRGIDTSPTWSSDGEKIAFTSDRSGSPQIYIMDAEEGDSKMIKRITFNGYYNDLPAWSPKGDMIAYSSLIKDNFQIIIKDLTNGHETQITKGGSSKESPTWAPNGRFLAFSSRVFGESAVFIAQTNRPGIRRLTFLKGGGFSPSWSPNFN